MANDSSDPRNSTFSLQIPPSIQQDAQAFSEKEGISLNQFIARALEEKLDNLRNEEWISKRKPMTPERAARFIALLDRVGSDEVEPGDELPEGYVSPFKRS